MDYTIDPVIDTLEDLDWDIKWMKEYKRIMRNINHLDERIEMLMKQRRSQVQQLKEHRANYKFD